MKQASTQWRARAALLLVATLAAPAASLAANIPEPVRKLSGTSDDAARVVLEKHAYYQRNDKSSWGRKIRFWWNDAARQCLQVTSFLSKVVQVDEAREEDCKVASAGAGGGWIEASDLMGLPRSAAEARLARAGFRAISTDMSKGDMIYIWWFNGRQCLAANIANDRYELVQSQPLTQCR